MRFGMFLGAALIALSTLSRAACIEDDTGTTVCLDAPPASIVSLYGAYSEILWEIGAGKAITARTKNDDTIPEMQALPVVGTGLRPNVEYILALNPQLVIARAGKAGSEALGALRERGVKVAAFDPQSLDELYSVIERMGALTGKGSGASALSSSIKKKIEEVRASTSRFTVRPSVAFEITAEPLTVAGGEGLVNELIAVAGGRNAITQPKKLLRLDLEALLAADPDFYIVQTGPMNRNPQPLSSRANFQALKAVKEGRTATVDEKLYSRPGPRIAEAAAELARLLHPEPR